MRSNELEDVVTLAEDTMSLLFEIFAGPSVLVHCEAMESIANPKSFEDLLWLSINVAFQQGSLVVRRLCATRTECGRRS